MNRLNFALVSLVLVFLFGPAAWNRPAAAAPQPTSVQGEGYYQLPTAPGVFRTVASGATDPTDLDTPVDPQPTGGNPNWALSGTFSTHGATATVLVELYHTATGSPCGVSFVGTLTGNAAVSVDGGLYPALEIIGGGTRGARYWDARVLNVSTGTVRLKGWTYGSQPAAAQ